MPTYIVPPPKGPQALFGWGWTMAFFWAFQGLFAVVASTIWPHPGAFFVITLGILSVFPSARAAEWVTGWPHEVRGPFDVYVHIGSRGPNS